MSSEEHIKDIICQVLVKTKAKELIYFVLNNFIPDYDQINLDYTGTLNDENYQFSSEDEMLEFYIKTPNIPQTFYWNKDRDNPDNIMVGANITTDNQIVFSITFDGSPQIEEEYFVRLKRALDSEIGVISYVNPVEYEDGSDFENKYGSGNVNFNEH